MKSKSIIGACVLAASVMAVTSCQDMFEIESNRVVYQEQHQLGSTADSVYTTLGILHNMQKIADRLIVLGEVRGDLLDVTSITKTSLRNIAEFNFEDENEYLQVKDYYNIINNCNYALAYMDTTLTHNGDRVMQDEYVAILGIRAWTYLQLGINHAKVPYVTEPITKVAEAEKDYPMLTIEELAFELIPQLMPYIDYPMPDWKTLKIGSLEIKSEKLFVPIRLLIGDLYLWLGDYANAYNTYVNYLTTNKDYSFNTESGEQIWGLMSFNGAQVETTRMAISAIPTTAWDDYSATTGFATGREHIAAIPMQTSSEQGTVSELKNLFISEEGAPQLAPSNLWEELSKKQNYYIATKDKNNKVTVSLVPNAGDQRYKNYTQTLDENKGLTVATKHFNGLVYTVSNGEISGVEASPNTHILLYRRAWAYLRAAEAANALAAQFNDAKYCVKAFNILKDAFNFFFPNGHDEVDELRGKVLGVHARGCGDVAYDTTTYVMTPAAIYKQLDLSQDIELTLGDSIRYVEELIIDELALEMALEGTRFGDLVRFAKRNNDPTIVAERIATRKGSNNRDEELYQKLMNQDNWYLPLK